MYRFPAVSVLTFFTIFLAPYLFYHFPILPFYQFCHFVAAVSFTIWPFVSISGPADFNILPFNQFYQYRKPSHPSQSIHPIHVGYTCHDAHTSHSRKFSRYIYTIHTSLFRQSSQPKPPCRYSYPSHPNKSNLPRVGVRGGPTLTLASNKPTPTGRDGRSSHSSFRSHNFQSIHPFLPILRSQSFHTSHTGQYIQSTQKSKASQPTHSTKPSQRSKDRNPLHSTRPSKSSHSRQPIISVQSRRPTRSSQPSQHCQDGYLV